MRGWRRTFWVVFLSNLVSSAGLMSFLPFFPTLLERLGLEDEHAIAVWSGILFGAAPLSAAFMGPLWGSIGDRYGRKLMVVRSLFGLALFVGAMGWARTPWELLFLRVGQGLFSGFIPPSLTLVSVAAPRAIQGRVTSWLQTASTVGTIAGPLIGALLVTRLGSGAIFVSVAAGAGTSGLLVALLAREAPRQPVDLGGFSARAVLAGTWGDLVALLARPSMRAALVLYAAVHFALGATNPLMEFFVEQVWRGDPARVEELTGTLFSLLALAAIVATPLWGRWGDRAGHARALRLSSAGSGLSLLLHALAPAFGWVLALRVAFGFFSPGASASAFGLAATESEAERRGAAMGAVFSARALALALGGFAGGTLAALLGVRGLFAAAGGLILAVQLLVRPRR